MCNQGKNTAEEDTASAVKEVLAGNVNAFIHIVEKYQNFVMTIAMALKKDSLAAEELTQDVFVRAFERLTTFDPRRPMKPWLAQITCRLARDAWRTLKREREYQRLVQHQIKGSTYDHNPIDILIKDERDRILWQAIELLTTAERIAVLLYYQEGLAIKDVAKVTGVADGTTKKLLFRARSHLRVALKKTQICLDGQHNAMH